MIHRVGSFAQPVNGPGSSFQRQRRSAERSPLDATQRPSGEKGTLEDYTEAVRQLARDPPFPRDRLEPVERFLEIVRSIEA